MEPLCYDKSSVLPGSKYARSECKNITAGITLFFVYRRYIDFSVIQSLRDMKNKIAGEVRRRGLLDNIKLGAGGIREIEFIVQVFQLIRGGREIILQQPSLLHLLPALEKIGLIDTEQSTNLYHAYLFLRRVENILQAIDDKQTQTLPSADIDRERLLLATKNFTYFPISTENGKNRTCSISYCKLAAIFTGIT